MKEPFYALGSADGSATLFNLYNKYPLRKFNHPRGMSVDKVAFVFGSPSCFLMFSSSDKKLLSYSVNGQMLNQMSLVSECISEIIISHDPVFLNIAVSFFGCEKIDVY